MRTSFRQLNRLAPVPMLQMGRSRKRVEILRASRSKTRTRIVTALLSPWSLLSYIITENFSVLHRLVTLSSKAGAIAEFIMWVIFVLLQANFLAISESGNISLTCSVKWSATSNRRLCSATKYANNTFSLGNFVGSGWKHGSQLWRGFCFVDVGLVGLSIRMFVQVKSPSMRNTEMNITRSTQCIFVTLETFHNPRKYNKPLMLEIRSILLFLNRHSPVGRMFSLRHFEHRITNSQYIPMAT